MVKNILVTGSEGFIGKNLISALEQSGKYSILKYDINDTKEKLSEYLKIADFIFHLAGVNRPDNEKEFKEGNEDLTREIVGNIQKHNKKTSIVFSSSIQAGIDNPYGKSKINAENIVHEYAVQTGAKVYVYRLPNVFGKWCKPNYNSAVATFCHNIAHDKEIVISDKKKEVELVYIDDVINEFIGLLSEPDVIKDIYSCSNRTFIITLGELAQKIYSFRDIRKTLVIPDLSEEINKFLYATYLSYLDVKDFASSAVQKADKRGSLAELLKSNSFGQVFVSRSNKGVVRGNHYHNTKIEKFCVIKGKAVIKFRHILKKEIISYPVSGEDIKIVDIPPGYTHSIENTCDEELIVIFWASEIFNSDKPDTYSREV